MLVSSREIVAAFASGYVLVRFEAGSLLPVIKSLTITKYVSRPEKKNAEARRTVFRWRKIRQKTVFDVKQSHLDVCDAIVW
jgi:hypothetical protein